MRRLGDIPSGSRAGRHPGAGWAISHYTAKGLPVFARTALPVPVPSLPQVVPFRLPLRRRMGLGFSLIDPAYGNGTGVDYGEQIKLLIHAVGVARVTLRGMQVPTQLEQQRSYYDAELTVIMDMLAQAGSSTRPDLILLAAEQRFARWKTSFDAWAAGIASGQQQPIEYVHLQPAVLPAPQPVQIPVYITADAPPQVVEDTPTTPTPLTETAPAATTTPPPNTPQTPGDGSGASWFTSSTDLFGVAVPNLLLLAGAGLLVMGMDGGKGRR